jgi:hypothetical protein
MTGRRECDDRESGGVVHLVAGGVAADTTADLHLAPLVDLLSEIRALRDLRDRGQISAAEYERRRVRLLEKI